MLFVSVNADAVCLKGNPSISQEYADSPIVLIGKVISKKDVAESRDYYEGDEYTVQVQELLKGVLTNPLLIFSENSSGRFPMDVGGTYLLFVHEELNRYQVSNCGNSGLLSMKKDALDEIRSFASPRVSKEPDTKQLRQLCRDILDLNTQRQQTANNTISHLPPNKASDFAVLMNSTTEEEMVRAGAATALGGFGVSARQYIPDLAKLLNDTSLNISASAAGSLSELVNQNDAAIVPDLIRRLDNRRPNCGFECFWTIGALAKIGPAASPALPTLRKIVQDRKLSSAMQAEAQGAIEMIKGSNKP